MDGMFVEIYHTLFYSDCSFLTSYIEIGRGIHKIFPTKNNHRDTSKLIIFQD